MLGAEVLEWKMSKVRGGQIIDVLSSHNKELCHVDELKNLANFFFKASGCLGEKLFARGGSYAVVT